MKKLLLVAVLAIVGAITGCDEAKFPYLISIAVSPGTASVTAGATQQFTAQGTFSNGSTRDLTSLVTWSSSNTSVATIITGGLATSSTQGTSTISASFNQPAGMVTGSATLTVTAPTLTSILVSPATALVAAGGTQQFTAQGTFSNGTTSDITSQVTWSSSTTSVATIAAGGLATGHTQGSSTITASFTQASGTVTGSATLTVSELTSIKVSPATPSVEAGLSQQFTAQGTFSNGTTSDITSQVTWSSSTIFVASIATGGLASTYTQGQSTITASLKQASGTVTGTATLTVTAAKLVSIVIVDNSVTIPGPNSVANAQTAVGIHDQFGAYGIYTDGGERNISSSVTWSSSAASVATINNRGLALGVSPGSATITATDSATGLTQNVAFVVTNATVTAIVVSPANRTIAPDTQLNFSAFAEFSDGTAQDITVDAKWSSTNTAVATISTSSNPQVATALSTGSTMIHAALGGTTGSATLNVSSATPVSIALTPPTSGVAIGSRLFLQAIGTFTDGTKQRLVRELTWSVTPSNGSIATVDTQGVVTGVALGTATVTAKFGTVSGTATVNVQNLGSITAAKTGPLDSQAITARSGLSTIAAGTKTQYRATAKLADGTTQDVTADVTWISTSPATAVIVDQSKDFTNYSGWASGIAAGNTTIGAVFQGQFTPIPLTVSDATLTSIAITPAAPRSITLGGTQGYQATGTFSDSTTQDLTNLVTWTSSDPAVAIMNKFGTATSIGTGSTMVKAAADINGSTASDDKALTVTP